MNLKYMKVSLFEITYKKKMNFLIYWDAPVCLEPSSSFALKQNISTPIKHVWHPYVPAELA